MHTPVIFIIFNRPDTTAQVFSEISKAQPPKLFIVADGPRPGHPTDAERCAATRAIVEKVDWDCEVWRDYAEVNLGCGKRPATGISWAFEHVEEAIILEDDCVPHPTFFRFCEELLACYRDDERIMHIAGNNFLFGRKAIPYSYFFSYHNICWGWATWRRAWQHVDMALSLWPMLRQTSWLLDILGDARAVQYWQAMFDHAYAQRGNVDYWDYQWTFACWAHSGLSILPRTTLVTNIGFGEAATHTRSTTDRRAFLPTEAMHFPLRHPPYVVRDGEADRYILENVVLPFLPQPPSLACMLRQRVAPFIPSPLRRSLKRLRSIRLSRL